MAKNEDLKNRTKKFALRIIKLASALPSDVIGNVIARQIVKSGTSVGANYRSALRGRSKAEFLAKLGIVLEEADECGYWLELIEEARLIQKEKISNLRLENEELIAIFCAMIKKTKK